MEENSQLESELEVKPTEELQKAVAADLSEDFEEQQKKLLESLNDKGTD